MSAFESAGLRPELLEAIAKLGFENPTPIQERTLALLNQPAADMIALAQTGTGKTAAFGLPLLQRIETGKRAVQALILCPTRELCLQIVNDIKDYARFMGGVDITAVYGGAPIDTQIRALRKGTHIVVGTPGRVVDMLSRGELRLGEIDFFVLDEADEMLNMGFKDDLEAIFEQTPEQKSTWLFSATMHPKVESIAERYMNNPEKISVGKRNEGNANIAHHYYVVQARDRFEALSRIVAAYDDMYGVVFCRTRTETTDIAERLSRKGYSAQAINGDLSQQQRDKVMGAFRKGHVKLLVATDVAARGLDVEELSHVVNYNLPDDPEVYVHRSGRTGRAGKTGICISILHSREQYRVRDLERITRQPFERREVPLLSEIAKYHVLAAADRFIAAKGKLVHMGDIPAVVYMKFEGLDREAIIEQWILTTYALQAHNEPGMPDDINAAATGKSTKAAKGRDTRDREPRERDSRESYSGNREPREYDAPRGRRERSERDEPGAFTEVEINIGRQQFLKPNKIMGIINDVTGNKSINFGRIDIFEDKSFVGVESAHAKEVAEALDGMQFGSRKLTARVKVGGKPSGGGGYKKPTYTSTGRNDNYKPRSSGSSSGSGGYWKSSEPSAGGKFKKSKGGAVKKRKW